MLRFWGNDRVMSRGFVLFGLTAFACLASCCSPAGSPALPAGRHYEMVSPVYKGGYGVLSIEAEAADGDSVVFYSPGVFNGAPSSGVGLFGYIARRGSTNWSTTPIMPTADLMPYVDARDIEPNLETTLAFGKDGPNREAASNEGTEEEFLLHATASPDTSTPDTWPLTGMPLSLLSGGPPVLSYDGASPDFCHLLVGTGGSDEVLTPEAVGAVGQIYELDPGCGGESASLSPLALNDAGRVFSPRCSVEVGISSDYSNTRTSAYNAVADDGNEVFFTTCAGDEVNGHYQLFVRLAGARTLEVSKPILEACGEVPCNGSRESSNFAGASEDGSKVYFTTSAPLESGASGSNLYLATIGCDASEPECEVAGRVVTSLTQVSRAPNGEAAGLQGVVRVAPNGSRVYFVAQGDLLTEAQRVTLEDEGRAVPRAGADNLYVYDSVLDRMAFVGDLCSGKEVSGTVGDPSCPNEAGTDSELWEERESEAQTAGVDGSFLVFSSYAQLVPGDDNNVRDIYRYDAETGALVRVSVGENGYNANGNGDDNSREDNDASVALGDKGGSVSLQYELGTRAISESGSRIVFTSAEPLSPAAAGSHLPNVYEWHEEPGGSGGDVSLISSGDSTRPVEDVAISAEGNDIFFVTSQGLVSQDVDGAPDLYDAREGSGFPLEPAETQQCEGEGCDGPLTNPAPLLVPGSVSQAPEEYTPPKTAARPKAKKKHKKAKKKPRKASSKEGRTSRKKLKSPDKAGLASGVRRRAIAGTGHGGSR